MIAPAALGEGNYIPRLMDEEAETQRDRKLSLVHPLFLFLSSSARPFLAPALDPEHSSQWPLNYSFVF